MSTFAEKVISFYKEVDFNGSLPEGVSIMNPYKKIPGVIPVITQFYSRFYNDNKSRNLILGINPGRHGAGVTGIPFTDTKRLWEMCGIKMEGFETHEPSSVFIYEMIDKYGSMEKFYSDFFISAVSPLGFTYTENNGKEVNCNYYDSKELTETVYDFIISSINRQLEFGIERDVCFCLGTGQNFKFLAEINNKFHFFSRIMPLEHPRYIMQYKSIHKQDYIAMYIDKLQIIKS